MKKDNELKTELTVSGIILIVFLIIMFGSMILG